MPRPLFEQYKDALRRGHVAVAGDELELALAAYRMAAALVPDRPLPYASMGAVLQRLGHTEEALGAYDRAVALAPDDEALARTRAALVTVPAAEPLTVVAPVAVAERVVMQAPVLAPDPVSVPEPVAPPEPARPARDEDANL